MKFQNSVPGNWICINFCRKSFLTNRVLNLKLAQPVLIMQTQARARWRGRQFIHWPDVQVVCLVAESKLLISITLHGNSHNGIPLLHIGQETKLLQPVRGMSRPQCVQHLQWHTVSDMVSVYMPFIHHQAVIISCTRQNYCSHLST